MSTDLDSAKRKELKFSLLVMLHSLRTANAASLAMFVSLARGKTLPSFHSRLIVIWKKKKPQRLVDLTKKNEIYLVLECRSCPENFPETSC